ncbi:MAG: peptidylprolyl isomerase [Syntrophaceae bacterium]|nr:peptidylprolyl isomerase [Syntrophaceae bacterium]
MSKTKEITATIETTKGTIGLNLFADTTPVTVGNFVNLARRTYYDGLSFHRVISDFMIQGGCPQGDGRGGPGYQFEDEFSKELRHNKAGVLSMANAGSGTNGSQFFITHVATPWLDDHHTVFGEVVGSEDQEVVNAVAQGDTIKGITLEGNVEELLENVAPNLDEWNRVLDKNFPDLP